MIPAPETVTLTTGELMIAAQVASMRRVKSVTHGRQHRHGFNGENAWDVDVKGACGECAVSKYLNVYWFGMYVAGGPSSDVGRAIEVRWTYHADGRLIIHPDDPNDSPFVLVTGSDLVYTLRGWIRGRDGKGEQWWADPTGKNRPAYFVPQYALRPMAELLECLKVPA